MNPYEGKLSEIRKEISKIQTYREVLSKELASLEKFNIHEKELNIKDLLLKIEDIENKIKNQKEFIFNYNNAPKKHPNNSTILDIINNLFQLNIKTPAQQIREAKIKYEDNLTTKLSIAIKNRDAYLQDIDKINNQINEHKLIDGSEIRNKLKSIIEEEKLLLEKKNEIQIKYDSIQIKITPLLDKIQEIDAEIKKINLDLNKAHHSPQNKKSNLLKIINNKERQRNKLYVRIGRELQTYQRVIKRVFLDGNNLSNKQSHYKKTYIGTQALEALATELLTKGYEVIIVFDHQVSRNKEISFDRIEQNFEPEVKLYRASPDTSADTILMSLAKEETDCIISNDRFIDYLDKSIVIENRIFRCFINNETAIIEQLDIEARLRVDVNFHFPSQVISHRPSDNVGPVRCD